MFVSAQPAAGPVTYAEASMVASNTYEARLARVEHMLDDLRREYDELRRSTSAQGVQGRVQPVVPKRGGYKKFPVRKDTTQ